MNDWKTRDVVSHIFEKMGYKKLSEYIKKDAEDLEIYIKYIKYKMNEYSEMKELINNFL